MLQIGYKITYIVVGIDTYQRLLQNITADWLYVYTWEVYISWFICYMLMSLVLSDSKR